MTMRHTISVNLDTELIAALDQRAREIRESRSFVLRDVLRQYFLRAPQNGHPAPPAPAPHTADDRSY